MAMQSFVPESADDWHLVFDPRENSDTTTVIDTNPWLVDPASPERAPLP